MITTEIQKDRLAFWRFSVPYEQGMDSSTITVEVPYDPYS
jgi:hypothetical protein